MPRRPDAAAGNPNEVGFFGEVVLQTTPHPGLSRKGEGEENRFHGAQDCSVCFLDEPVAQLKNKQRKPGHFQALARQLTSQAGRDVLSWPGAEKAPELKEHF
jgi:hypothetical protein